MTGSYAYSNTHPAAPGQHERLSQILDGDTTICLTRLTVPWPTARCLEVGFGGGSIAGWLTDMIGPEGHVLATDISPRGMPAHDRLRVLEHDITTGVPPGPWDVIHVRLVLMHLPQREQVLRSLAAALTPGGVLLVEDWDQTWVTGRVVRAPSPAAAALWTTFNDAVIRLLAAAGTDPAWASGVQAAMTDAGLVDVTAQVRCRTWPGGTPGALLAVSTIGQLRSQLIDQGLTGGDLEQVTALMHHPDMVIRQYPLVQTAGYRAAG